MDPDEPAAKIPSFSCASRNKCYPEEKTRVRRPTHQPVNSFGYPARPLGPEFVSLSLRVLLYCKNYEK